jgi:hypothetical protein
MKVFGQFFYAENYVVVSKQLLLKVLECLTIPGQTF